MVDVIENSDIQPQKPSIQTQEIEDVNFLVQKKCQDNQIGKEEQKDIITFFKNIENKLPKEYQKDLLDYIKNIDGNKLFMISIADENEKTNQEKTIIDQIDLKQKQPLIETYSTVEDEKSTVEDEKSTVEDEKSTVEDVIETKTNETIITKYEIESNLKMAKALSEARDNFKEIPDTDKSEGKLEDQDKETQDLINQKIDKINEINPDIPITADEFLNMQLTAQKCKLEGKNNKFVESFDKLDRLTDSKPIDTLKSSEGADKAIKYSESLNKYKQSIDTGDDTPSNEQYETKREELTNLENPDEINEKFEDKENQILIQKYTKLLPKQPEEDSNKSKEQNDQQLLKRKKDTIIQANDIAQQSKNILQNRILGSAISGLAGYFDFSTEQKESVGDDLKIKDGFDINQNIFSLKGNINGKEIEMNYNLSNGNLSIEDYLFQEKDQNVMRIGQNKFQDLKIQLPSIAMLRNQALNIGDKEISEDNPKKYLENLENDLHQELTSNFKGNQEIVKVRLERSVQKNLAVQETLNDFNKIISSDGKDFFTNKNFGKETTNKHLFKLIGLVDNSLEKYSISEIEQLRQNMPKLKDFITNKIKNPSKINIIKDNFKKIFDKEDNQTPEELEQKRTKSLYRILRSMSERDNGIRTINLDELSKTTNELQKAEPDLKNMPVSFAENIISKPEDKEALEKLENEIQTA